VRAKVRGTREDHAIWTLIVSPGATGRSSGTSITVRSSAFPSSGAMKRVRAVTSAGAAPPIRRTLVTSIQPQSASGRSNASRSPRPSARSRIQVERVLRHAL
jgi:hypothetical protein